MGIDISVPSVLRETSGMEIFRVRMILGIGNVFVIPAGKDGKKSTNSPI